MIALYGPTASGKTAVAGLLRDRLDGEVVSADSAALYAGIPILTAAPAYPARLVGILPLERDVSVGEYQRLAHDAIDEILEDGGTPIVAGGTGLYLRAALSALELPPPPAPGARERWGAFYDDAGPEEAHAALERLDPAAAARVHPNDRRRVIRALELTDLGASLAPAEDSLWTADARHPTLLVGLDVALEELDARIEERVAAMIAQGAADEARGSLGRAAPSGDRAQGARARGARDAAPPTRHRPRLYAATRRLARYQRKWLRRLPVAATLDGSRPPEEIADAIVALAGTGERLPRR